MYKVASTSGEVQVATSLTPDWKGEGVGLQSFHVKVMKKVTSILRLGKKNSFLGLQNLEAKEIVQKVLSLSFQISS
jgi:hypothetical protein